MSRRKNGVRASVRALSSVTGPAERVDSTAVTGEPSRAGSGSQGELRPTGPGYRGDLLHGPDGRVYRRESGRISPGRAQELLAAGAAMAVDDCGCGGFCGLEWPSPAERTDLARRPPALTRRRFGWLEEWRSADGHSLLLQNGDVRWP